MHIGWKRWLTHALLAAGSLAGWYAFHFYAPHADLTYVLTLGCGYVSLGLLVAGLLIGPLNLLRQRRNPVNINLRRDVGIWAGINGCLHVFFGLQVQMGGNILLYFLDYDLQTGYRLRTNRFGFTNDIGLIATFLLVALLVLSNDLSLRKLKGKRWKWVQRFNYGLFVLVLIHTFVYQSISGRDRSFVDVVVLLMLVTLVGQFVGITIMRQRLAAHRPRRLLEPGSS